MNVKIEAKVKMAHILFVSIFLASGKIEKKKTNKRAGSSEGLSPKFGPTIKRNPSESINSQFP